MCSVTIGEALMISGLFRGVIVAWDRFTLGPVGFGPQVFVAAYSYPFQFFHDVFLPVSIKGPGVDWYDCQACFGVLRFFSFDPFIVILSSNEAVVLDVGAELRKVIIGIPDPRLSTC